MELATEEGIAPAVVIGRFALRGGGGEPVDWPRTLASHGVASLPPNRIDMSAWTLATTLPVGQGGSQSVLLRADEPGLVTVLADQPLAPSRARHLLACCRDLLRLDADLSPFYRLAEADADLGWVAIGAGRMLRSPSVFEDLVKTICTTNCSWSATERMVGALVQDLGRPDQSGHHAFPTPAAMAEASPDFYRLEARTGYRGAYIRELARSVAGGDLDLEQLKDPELPDGEVGARLLALAGVGPYATAHIMLTALGRYRRLVLDSWTRPAYARLSGKPASDRQIGLRFRRFRQYQGLAFWLYLTRDWVAG